MRSTECEDSGVREDEGSEKEKEKGSQSKKGNSVLKRIEKAFERQVALLH